MERTMRNRVRAWPSRWGAVVFVPVLAIAGAGRAFARFEPAEAPAAPASHQPTDISSILESLLKKHDVPALAAVIVRGDGTIVMQGAAGVRQVGTTARVTMNDLFHLGSCTKAMTATLCAILVHEGTLAWDTTLEDVFPALFATTSQDSNGTIKTTSAASPAWKGVTLLNLLTHRSGMPTDLKRDGLWSRLWRFKGGPEQARQMLLEGVLAVAPGSTPGTKFEYANAGFAVAGHMAEVKTGVPWETLIQQKLFTPLGITTAGFGAPGAVTIPSDSNEQANLPPEIDQPRGHRKNGTPVQPGPGSDNPVAIAPAGTVHMSLADWSKFVALHLRGAEGRLRDTDPVKQVAFATLHQPIPKRDEPKKADDGYACGWGVTTRSWAGASKTGSHRVLTHSGSNTMWYCVVWMAPERDFAVLVACNRGGDQGAKATDAAAALLIGEIGKVDH